MSRTTCRWQIVCTRHICCCQDCPSTRDEDAMEAIYRLFWTHFYNKNTINITSLTTMSSYDCLSSFFKVKNSWLLDPIGNIFRENKSRALKLNFELNVPDAHDKIELDVVCAVSFEPVWIWLSTTGSGIITRSAARRGWWRLSGLVVRVAVPIFYSSLISRFAFEKIEAKAFRLVWPNKAMV